MTKPDAFAVSADLMPADEAIARLVDAVEPVAETETLPLQQVLGRALAEDVISDRNSPPFDNTAVDGYAVRHADLPTDGMKSFPVSLRIPAGAAPGEELAPGQAARIFTGAPVPVGADTIIPQEVCEADEANGSVALPPVKKPGANLRQMGEDVKVGDLLLGTGTFMRPQEIGLAASVGRASLNVRRKLKVAVFSTGDEVRDPGGDAPAGCIFDANRFALIGLLQNLGCEPVDCGILTDEEDTVVNALQSFAPGVDAILTSGGISTGEEDHVKSAVKRLGGINFWRVAIRPGRPLAFGTIMEKPFVGLPGNPVAAMVCFMMFVRPLLLKLGGRTATKVAAPLLPSGFEQKKRAGRREWLRGSMVTDDSGQLVLQKFRTAGSGVLTSMTESDGLIELLDEPDMIRPGDPLRFMPFSSLLS